MSDVTTPEAIEPSEESHVLDADETVDSTVSDAPLTGDAAWVEVALMGDEVDPVAFRAGMTVGDVIRDADLTTQRGQVLHLDGEPASLDSVVRPGSTVMITSSVANGLS